MFVQVRADEFVKYDFMAQKLCEVSVSLTFYLPGSASVDKATSLLEERSGQAFSAANSYTNLRNATRSYFADPKNRFYAEKAKASSNPNFDFEAEVRASDTGADWQNLRAQCVCQEPTKCCL